MKDLKNTLKRIVEHESGTKPLWRVWMLAVWRPYVALAAAADLAAIALLVVSREVLLPVIGGGAALGEAMSGASIAWCIAFVLAAAAAVYASIVAHKAMKRVVGQYAEAELARGRRNLLLAESASIVATACWVAALPAVVVFVSAVAAKSSAMFAPAPATPLWAWVTYAMSIALGMLLVEITLTIVRLAFRRI